MHQKKNAVIDSARIKSERSDLSSKAGMVIEPMTDEVLASRIVRGDSVALEELYDRYASTVLGIALKILGEQGAAEDILQETFWRVWKSAFTFRSDRGTFSGWLFRIARNLSIDAYRRSNVRPQIVVNDAGEEEEPIVEQMPDPVADVVEQTQINLKNHQVRSALALLPQVQRQVIELSYFYGMTRQEIADSTGEALGTIHTRARLGLKKLREELNKEEFEG
jgi:RNA polymerase sigma-70 factor (ECF subfamily)